MARFSALRPALPAAVACVMLLSAGCAGQAGNTTAQGGRGQLMTGGSAPPDVVVSDYRSYVGSGGGAVDPAKSPVVLGWVNLEGGTVSLPEATAAARAAVDYVNAALGGVGTHPLVLEVCPVANAEEEGQKCAQRMLSNQAISTVAVGALNVGDSSFTAVTAGEKPTIVGVATGPALSTAKNTYILFGDLPRIFASWGTYAKEALNATTAALLYTNVPGDRAAADAVRRGLEANGIKVKAVGFDAQATDLIGPVTAAGSATADVVIPIAQGSGCVGLAKAFSQLGVTKPIVATPVCLSDDVAQGFGGDLPHWIYGTSQTLPSDQAADAKQYLTTATQHGLAAADAGKVFAALAWSTVLAFVKLANAAGPDQLSPATMTQQLKAFSGPVVMGAPQVACGAYPQAPAVCNDRAKFYRYEGKGAFTSLTPWLQPRR